MNKSKIISLQNLSNKIRIQILSMIVDAKASHIGSSYSCVELLVYLYSNILKIDPKKPNNPTRDKFLLSKGWAVTALYATLANYGFFNAQQLKEYCRDGSKFVGTATRNGISGIEATTGSMGHGLPIGVGMALSGKIKKLPSRVIVLMSDGECDEGSTWEAALQAGHHKLDNLIVVIDHNKLQSFGFVKNIIDLHPLKLKWESFNWEVIEVSGHDFEDIEAGFKKILNKKGKPKLVIAHTIKGKGVSIFENKNEWHYRTPQNDEVEIARKELGA